MTVSDARERSAGLGFADARRAGGEANEAGNAIAVVPVRGGVLPVGGDEAVAEAGGTALLVGSGPATAADELAGVARRALTVELGPPAFGAWAAALAPVLASYDLVVLPGSPDGRDLAPRLAARLSWPLLAGATEVHGRRVSLVRRHGKVTEEVEVDGPYVVTLQPGVRGCERTDTVPAIEAVEVVGPAPTEAAGDAEVVEELSPDAASMDLAEAPRILAGGAGLGGEEGFALLSRVAAALDAAVGATRVVTDHGWVAHERQIGTTGVTVDPDLYVAFGISGAVQHVAGLGTPRHVVSVNTDPSCPMTAMADLALVTDAPALLRVLAEKLGVADD